MKKRNKKLISWSLSVLAIIYLTLILFPQILFANSFEYKYFKVYYHSETIDKDALSKILDNSLQLLERSELLQSDVKQKLFICNSYGEFTFFSPRSRKAFAVNYPLTQNIFLTTSNIKSNSITRNDEKYNKRTLSGVIAHETTHSLLENRLGFIKYKMLPSWKNEGYCDFIANESSYKTTNEKDAICNSKNESKSPSLTYFKYRMFVKYLFENEDVKFDKFLSNEYNLETLEQKFCKN